MNRYISIQSLRSICYSILIVFSLLIFLPHVQAAPYSLDKSWPELEQPWYFDRPESLAIGPSGLIFIADTGSNRVQVFNNNGEFVRRWGKRGSGEGAFVSPAGITVSNSGLVYVADTNNHRIQVFDVNGVFLQSFGGKQFPDVTTVNTSQSTKIPEDKRTIRLPTRIVFNDNKGLLYVSESCSPKIHIFNITGEYVRTFGGDILGNDYSCFPREMAIDDNGFIYVLNETSNGFKQIYVFDGDDQLIRTWGSQVTGDNYLDVAVGLAILADGLVGVLYNHYIRVNVANVSIRIFNTDGHFIRSREIKTSTNRDVRWEAKSITVSSDDSVYLLTTDDSIQVFDAENKQIHDWGASSAEQGKLNLPHALAVDSNDLVYVSDRGNHRIQVFDSNGGFVREWGEFGVAQGHLAFPSSIAISSNNFVYIADSQDRIQVFSNEGHFIRAWGGPGSKQGEFSRINGIAINRTGLVYVLDFVINKDSDSNHNRIQVFDNQGQFIRSWNRQGVGEDLLTNATGLAISSTDLVHILTNDGNSVHVFNEEGEFVRRWVVTSDFNFPTGINRESFFRSFIGNGIAIDESDRVYVTSSSTINLFNRNGKFIESTSVKHTTDNPLISLDRIAVNSKQAIFATNPLNHQIVQFSRSKQKPVVTHANQLSGSWYNPDRIGEGFAIEMLANNQAQVTWYTYDAFGNQAWMVGVGEWRDNTITVSDALITYGGNFGNLFDSADVKRIDWGRIVMTFNDCNHATVTYNGLDSFGFGSLDLERLASISGLGCEIRAADARATALAKISGSWYNPDRNGEGFLIQVADNNQAVVYWYTYDQEGNQMWVTGSGQVLDRKIIINNGLFTEAARFGTNFDANKLQFKEWGRITFDFSSCNKGVVNYESSAGFGNGMMSLQRLTSIDDFVCDSL